jgi:hypothetical protein
MDSGGGIDGDLKMPIVATHDVAAAAAEALLRRFSGILTRAARATRFHRTEAAAAIGAAIEKP